MKTMSSSTLSILVQRQFTEHKKIYGIGILVLFALLIFMFLVVHQWQDSFSGAVQNGVFIIGLFISGVVFSSTMFGELSSPKSSIWLLSIPSTHAEKVLLSIFLSVPCFLATYLLVFYLADILYLYVINTGGNSTLLDLTKNNFYHFFFQYLVVNGLILLGSILFNRHSLIKTVLVCILLFASINYVNNGLLSILIPEASVVSSLVFDSFLFSHQGENIKVMMSGSTDIISTLFVRLVMPLSLWFAVWLKLKEKQV